LKFKIVSVVKLGPVSALKTNDELEAELNAAGEDGFVFKKVLSNGALLLSTPERINITKVARRRRHEDQDEETELRKYKRLFADAQQTLYDMQQLLGPEKTQEWERLKERLVGVLDDRNRITPICTNLAEALIWCSGSSDFAEGGAAAEGWAKGPRKALEEYRKFMGGF
jgi:hypothetical protein